MEEPPEPHGLLPVAPQGERDEHVAGPDVGEHGERLQRVPVDEEDVRQRRREIRVEELCVRRRLALAGDVPSPGAEQQRRGLRHLGRAAELLESLGERALLGLDDPRLDALGGEVGTDALAVAVPRRDEVAILLVVVVVVHAVPSPGVAR